MPYLAGSDSGVIYSQTVKVCGAGESKAETLIKDMIDSQDNPTIATYAKIVKCICGLQQRRLAKKKRKNW